MLGLPICLRLLVKKKTRQVTHLWGLKKLSPEEISPLLDLCLQNGGSFVPRRPGVFVIIMKPPVILNSFARFPFIDNKFFIATKRELATPETMSIKQ